MQSKKVLRSAAVFALMVTVATATMAGSTVQTTAAKTGHVRSSASPALVLGPQAVPAATTSPKYGLFTCQIVGLSPGVTCYDPFQIRAAYNIESLIDAGFDGFGKTIVIIDAFQAPKIVSQLSAFISFYGLPGMNGLGAPNDPNLGTFTQIAPDGLTPFDPTSADMISWANEISLDVQWAHAIAPRANITLVLSASDQDSDIERARAYAVGNQLGDVISQSFGEAEICEEPSLVTAQHQDFANATRNGVTVFASSGDSGAGQPTCNGASLFLSASTPASDPLVTAVGGTQLEAARYCLTVLGCNPASNPTPGTYESEVVWNESVTGFGASGGGFSVLYGTPSYQKSALPAGGKQLGVPDVSYTAAVLHGVLVYLDVPGETAAPAFYLFGGTSVGSPNWAAILAIADQKAGHDLGFINKALYHIGQAPPHYAASFFDVTSGNNSFGGVTGYSAGPGWDPATGLGSPDTAQLVDRLIQFVSPGDSQSAIAQSANTKGNSTAPGHQKPH
jgi:subtilase family serine protease